jgi:hypothetical protein
VAAGCTHLLADSRQPYVGVWQQIFRTQRGGRQLRLVAVDDRLGNVPRCPGWRGCSLGLCDAIHSEHPIVTPEVAPGSEVRAVGTDHDVLRFDIALGLDPADVD